MRSIKAKLKRPAVASASNKDEWTKLDQRIWHSVAANQPVKLAAKFSKHSSVNVNKLCPSVGYSVVHYAAAKGLDDCLNVLLAHNANNSTRDVSGATPLHASARYGHKGTTSKLLATSTVDVNARDYNHCTALHFAAFEGHLECVKLIASNKDCDIHCVDKDGRTALMVAAAMGRLPVCQELILRGVNVNHVDSSSLHHTALTLAAEAGYADVVKLLCESGANYSAKLSDGRTALDVARGRSRRSVVDALHVIQLTEAAKKTDRNSRLSIGGSKPQNEKPEAKPRIESRNEAKVAPEPQPRLHVDKNQRTSPIANDLKHERASPSDHSANATTMSIYNDTKHGSLYDRDVSLYDSKSTLASVSSLDVSSVLEANKSIHNESPSTPHLRVKDTSSKQAVRLTEELVQKEEQINRLEQRLHELVASSKREVESLRTSNSKYEQSLQEMEKANDRLSRECMKLQLNEQKTMQQLEDLQGSQDQSKAFERDLEMLQTKLFESGENAKRMALKMDQIVREKDEALACYEKERDQVLAAQSGLAELLLDIGVASVNDDYNASWRLLKCEIQQLQQKHAKKLEEDDKRKLELKQFESKILEQDDIIKELKSRLKECEAHVDRVNEEKAVADLANTELRERLLQANEVNSHHANSTTQLQQDLSRLKEQLVKEKQNKHDIRQLEEKLELSVFASKQATDELSSDRLAWKESEIAFEKKIEKISEKYNEAKQEIAENEKTISQLRAERNQREALVTKSEKERQKLENRRKEIEVETNRIRQQLTESRQKCSKLEEEVVSLRKSKKDLSNKLSSVKLYECTEVERQKIDSMKIQLENLCKHIQESEKKYNETISAYRGHLLMAAKGQLNPEVLTPLREILKLQEEMFP